jgi:hypothetical protein
VLAAEGTCQLWILAALRLGCLLCTGFSRPSLTNCARCLLFDFLRDDVPTQVEAVTLQRQNDRAGAEREYRAAIAADPTLREPYRALAALLAARGETAEAARLWERGQAGR